MAGAERPRLAVVGVAHAIDEAAELGRRDGDDVPDLVGEPLPRRVAILDRREHRAEKQHRPVGILMVRADHLRNEIGGVAAGFRDRGKTPPTKTAAPLHGGRYVLAPTALPRDPPPRQPHEPPPAAPPPSVH